jgi:hypothetical protein
VRPADLKPLSLRATQAVLLAIAASMARALRVVREVHAELLLTAALLAGWALVTDAIARLAPSAQVWRFSLGALLLSLVGWRYLYTLFAHGLYKLTRDERAGGPRG